jgi:hypothetical protein
MRSAVEHWWLAHLDTQATRGLPPPWLAIRIVILAPCVPLLHGSEGRTAHLSAWRYSLPALLAGNGEGCYAVLAVARQRCFKPSASIPT